MSNVKGETIISVQAWGLLSFCITKREGSVIYLINNDKLVDTPIRTDQYLWSPVSMMITKKFS